MVAHKTRPSSTTDTAPTAIKINTTPANTATAAAFVEDTEDFLNDRKSTSDMKSVKGSVKIWEFQLFYVRNIQWKGSVELLRRPYELWDWATAIEIY